MTRVWYDEKTQFIMVDGISPKPAGSLTATFDGFMIRAIEPTGRGIFAFPIGELADQYGTVFKDGPSAMQYLDGVLNRTFSVDGGTV